MPLNALFLTLETTGWVSLPGKNWPLVNGSRGSKRSAAKSHEYQMKSAGSWPSRCFLTNGEGRIEWHTHANCIYFGYLYWTWFVSNQQMANRVLAFLTEKYDSRSWFVLVHDLPPVEYNSIENRWGQYPWAANDPSLHRASVKGKNVLASSVGPEDRWTEEELLAVRQSVNRYCFSPAYTNNR